VEGGSGKGEKGTCANRLLPESRHKRFFGLFFLRITTDGQIDYLSTVGGLKMQVLIWRTKKDEIPENAGPENAGPQKHDGKLEDKLPKAITQCNSG